MPCRNGTTLCHRRHDDDQHWTRHAGRHTCSRGAGIRRGDLATQSAKGAERIGVYDSRSVAVAYAGTAAFNTWLSSLKEQYAKAKASGDTALAAKLEAQGKGQQTLMHKQGFSTAPVDNILDTIKDQLPGIREKAGVTVLVSKWDKDTLAKHPGAAQVDVTVALVDALKPNDRQRKSAIEIQKDTPIPLEQAAKIDD